MVGNGRLAAFVAFAALVVSLVGNASTLYVSQKADTHLCESSSENREKIREQIASGDPGLLKPGDPGYAYYQEHPDEKAALAAAVETSLNRFPSITCE